MNVFVWMGRAFVIVTTRSFDGCDNVMGECVIATQLLKPLFTNVTQHVLF